MRGPDPFIDDLVQQVRRLEAELDRERQRADEQKVYVEFSRREHQNQIQLTIKAESELDRERQRAQAAEAVIAAARCIRHWHDTANGGMIVSGAKVFELWDALTKYDAAMREGESNG